jgi:hypothetical protein
MKFTIEIECGNAAFEDNLRQEVARILNQVENELEFGWREIIDLHDYNGNVVGVAQFDQT